MFTENEIKKLCISLPAIRYFIISCYENKEFIKLENFLMALNYKRETIL